MMKVVRGLLALVAVVTLVLLGAFVVARSKGLGRVEKTWVVHTVDFPVPFPLSEGELASLREERTAGLDPDAGVVDVLAGVDLNALAQERAVARGKHLLESRYGCFDCHGRDLGGGTMIDAPPVGQFFGVNLTSGKGGVVAKYTVADWDRIVRHGVKPDGKGTVMPSVDFLSMSDQELSDIISYVRAQPPVDREMARPEYGPVGLMLMAKGDINITAELADHQKAHERLPPQSSDTKVFGKHLAQVCVGCHGRELKGGPIAGGDPSWPPAADISRSALANWTLEDFKRSLVEGKRRDGQALKVPMSFITAYGSKLTDQELQAMWTFLHEG